MGYQALCQHLNEFEDQLLNIILTHGLAMNIGIIRKRIQKSCSMCCYCVYASQGEGNNAL